MYLHKLCSVVSVRSIADFKKKLVNLIKTGYQYIYYDGSVFNQPFDRIKKIAKILNSSSIKPFSAHAWQLLPETGKNIKTILPSHWETLEKACILKAKYLTYHVGWCKGLKEGEDFIFENILKKHGIRPEGYQKENIYVLKEICKRAKDYGISPTIENLPKGCLCNFSTTMSDILEIIKEVDEPNLGVCFDSGHAFISGLNLYQEILKAKKFLTEIHLHDNLGRIGEENSLNDLHQPVGIGRINWIEVIAALKEVNYFNPVAFEIKSQRAALEINHSNWKTFLNLYEKKFKDRDFFSQ